MGPGIFAAGKSNAGKVFLQPISGGYVKGVKTRLNALYFGHFLYRFFAIFSIKTHSLVLHFSSD